MRHLTSLTLCLAVLAGCGQGGSGSTAVKKGAPAPEASAAAFALEGPGGTVALGDDLAKAKKAFPPPKGAQVFDQSMNYAILGTDGWSWAEERAKTGFEVALRDGKIFAFAVTAMDKAPAPDEAAQLAAKLGKPTRQATGKTSDALVWESGENARIVILFKTKAMLFGPGTMTLIGPKKDLAMLSYRSDDPETIVRIMDAGAEQMQKLEKTKG